MLNKTPLLHQSLGPHVCLSVCLSLSLHPPNSLERRNPSCSLTFLPGLLRPSQEGALYLHPLERAPGAFVSDASPVSRTLLVFCVNQGMLASLSLFYFLIVNSRPPGSSPLKDLNKWHPNRGLVPVAGLDGVTPRAY